MDLLHPSLVHIMPGPYPFMCGKVPVTLRKDSAHKQLTVCIPSDALETLTDDEIITLLRFTNDVAKRFRAVVPEGWSVIW